MCICIGSVLNHAFRSVDLEIKSLARETGVRAV